jgi:hypothetical protein
MLCAIGICAQKIKAAFWPPKESLPIRQASGTLTQIANSQITGLGFFLGFQRDGAEGESQGNGEHDREKLHPHGMASSLAR